MCVCRFVKKTLVLAIVVVILAIVAIVLLILHFVSNSGTNSPLSITIYSYEVLNTYDHNHVMDQEGYPNVGFGDLYKNVLLDHPFTQGLLFLNHEQLLESSGLYGSSYIRKFNLKDGKTTKHMNLPKAYFAEGTALIIDPKTYRKLILVLTYKEKSLLAYDYNTLELVKTLSYEFNGYGLTSNVDNEISEDYLKNSNFPKHQKLWSTSGDEFLYELEIPESIMDAETIKIKNKLKLTCAGYIIKQANELEYHHRTQTIFVNVFLTDLIIEFNATKGECVKIINLYGLAKKNTNYEKHLKTADAVLNGIAIKPEHSSQTVPNLFVTGKYWSNLFEIKLVKSADALSAAKILRPYLTTFGSGNK
ncbi:glutaminyl-peptide cyclotransferase, putative [Hepatocystis sp. ex Piliocolobus tephrosceles]|nr:glutaminyl-peptide cyclotransferase, putative [Hepatocystis sp. ex Piliocolobus tephrosceles]